MPLNYQINYRGIEKKKEKRKKGEKKEGKALPPCRELGPASAERREAPAAAGGSLPRGQPLPEPLSPLPRQGTHRYPRPSSPAAAAAAAGPGPGGGCPPPPAPAACAPPRPARPGPARPGPALPGGKRGGRPPLAVAGSGAGPGAAPAAPPACSCARVLSPFAPDWATCMGSGPGLSLCLVWDCQRALLPAFHTGQITNTEIVKSENSTMRHKNHR
ncbi:actin nucleation-promoting factor WAS-like [Phalacrocorax carbo]|uniref:actin nucleation-promoting factor WAS-like n=1 Tax=Phalacrocorax carbo TaxID=9209 RepID=UPI00311A585F